MQGVDRKNSVPEFVAYRFPEKEVLVKTGRFEEKDIHEEVKGFVVSNFTRTRLFHFVESEEKTNNENWKEFHFANDTPHCMSAREYYLQAHEILNGINMMQMDKVVFSRVKALDFDSTKTIQFFNNLCSTYPKAFVYLISSELFGTWIGASPEIILEAHQNFVFTTALAGTKKQNDSNEWGAKEKNEQQIVTDYVVQVLDRNKLSSIELIGPYDYNAGPVTHIRTDISAAKKEQNLWNLALDLHPTPAVSGFPKNESIELINSIEPHQREFYAGMIGVLEEDSCKLYVNLRCAQIQKDKMYLYLGGGFTPESIPELEWIETENKSKTLINCLP